MNLVSHQHLSVGVETSCKYPVRFELWKMRLCRAFGVDSLFIPDHLSTVSPEAGWNRAATPAVAQAAPAEAAFLEPFVMLGTMAARIGRVRLGTGVTDPLRRHPATLAQAFVTLDHLTRGRAILGIGSGDRENIESYGIDFHRRLERLEEALRVIRMLWDSHGRPVDFEGAFWRLRRARFELPLHRGRPPTIWVAAHGPVALAIAGRHGGGWYPTLRMTPAEYREKLGIIVRAGVAAGRTMDEFEAAAQVFVMLGPSRKEVLDAALRTPAVGGLLLSVPPRIWERHGVRHPLEGRYRGFGTTVARDVIVNDLNEASASATTDLIGDVVFAGSPGEIVEEIAPLVGAGMKHVVLANFGPMVRGFRIDDLLRFAILIRRLRRLPTVSSSAAIAARYPPA